MNKHAFYFLAMTFFFHSPWVLAVPLAQWQCYVQDKTNQQWHVESHYKRVALNKAFDACKKASAFPASCKPVHPNCEAFANGISISPLWKCVALDRMANPWASNLYDNRVDAALAAKAYCQANSSIPDTCYIYIFTCRNLNKL